MPARKVKRTAFVPRVVFRIAVTGAGAVPFCATAAGIALEQGCGNGAQIIAGASPCFDACAVAIGCFGDGPNRCPSVADAAFHDAAADHAPDVRLGVADATFKDAAGDHEAGMDVLLGVADVAFKDASPG